MPILYNSTKKTMGNRVFGHTYRNLRSKNNGKYLNMDNDGLKIFILTQNAIGNSIFNKYINLDDNFSDTINNNHIVIEFTQEDARYKINNLIKVDNTYINNNVAMNTLGGIDKNIIINVNSKKGLIKTIETHLIPINKSEKKSRLLKIYASKGAVCMRLTFEDENIAPLLLINAHLPMNKKQLNTNNPDYLGFQYRKSALKTIFDNVTEKYGNKEQNVLFAGDLNFRNVKGSINQIYMGNSNSIKNQILSGMQDLIGENNKQRTCKYVSLKKYVKNSKKNNKKNNSKKNNSEINNNNNDNNNNNENNDNNKNNTMLGGMERFKQLIGIQSNDIKNSYKTCRLEDKDTRIDNNCVDKKRTESTCDRIFFKPVDNNIITNLNFKIDYFENIKSDHNGIYASFNIVNTLLKNNNLTSNPLTINANKESSAPLINNINTSIK